MAQFGTGPELAAQRSIQNGVDANTSTAHAQEMNVGDTIGKLKLIERTHVVCGFRRGGPRTRIAFKCICECGTAVTVLKDNLASGHTKACGCVRMSRGGVCQTPEYLAWDRMKKRCAGADPHHKRYYTDRGISIDPRWESFENFFTDMGPMPAPGLTLERKNNDLGYSPDNCKWATWQEQSRNRRNSRWIEIDGVRKTLSDWITESKIPHSTVRNRIIRGISPKAALELS